MLLQTFLTGSNIRGTEATAKDYQWSAYLAFENRLSKNTKQNMFL